MGIFFCSEKMRCVGFLIVFLCFVAFSSSAKLQRKNPTPLVPKSECPACQSFFGSFCENQNGFEYEVCLVLESVCSYIVCPVDDVVDHLPFSDHDGDRFSTIFGLRGNAWRGKDCNDDNPNIYPGRRSPTSDPTIDYNCNGIAGGNSSTTYKEAFCANSGQMGVIVLGDSTDTHFGPPVYPFAGPDTWAEIFENELDWPQCSWATGHYGSENCQIPSYVPVDSFYLKLWRRNHCNHRDYQTIAVDGARSGPMATNIVNTTARNPSTDYPMLVLLALVGDDVCNPHPGGDHMTTPEEFKANILEILKYLEGALPPGSHVVTIGLLHGHWIWDIMHDQPYPYFGITYEQLWAMLSDHNTGGGDNRTLNPCWGWLNPDPYWRNFTTQRAFNLSQVYQTVIKEYQFKNFDLYYMDHVDDQVMKQWLAEGKSGVDLFQPVGGGHPSQTAHALWADAFWNYISENWPQILGPENPYNAEIEAIFGDQGGYD